MISRLVTTRLSFKQILGSLARLMLIEMLTVGMGIFVMSKAYDTYWNKTLPQIQTTDFEVLSHTLPIALSQAMSQNRRDIVQQILDSYQGVLSLVVTNATGEKIIAYSHSQENSEQKLSRLQEISPEILNPYPYHLLVKPLPFSPYQLEKELASNPKTSKTILGRIYYLKKQSPSFQEDLLQWSQNLFSKNSRFQLYSAVMVAFLGSGITLWTIGESVRIYRRLLRQEIATEQQKRELIEQEKRNLHKEAQRLKQQLEIQKQQNFLRIEQEQQQRNQLNLEQKQKQQKIKELQATIRQYESQINEYTEDLEVYQTFQNELEETQQQLEAYQEKEAIARSKINFLNDNIALLENKNYEYQKTIDKLEAANDSQKSLKLAITKARQDAEYVLEEAYKLDNINQQLQKDNQALETENNYLKYTNNRLKTNQHQLEAEIQTLQKNFADYQQLHRLDKNQSIPTSLLTNISSKRVVNALIRLGFVEDHQTGSHIILKRKSKNTCPVPHSTEVHPKTLKHILQQANVTIDEFLENLK